MHTREIFTATGTIKEITFPGLTTRAQVVSAMSAIGRSCKSIKGERCVRIYPVEEGMMARISYPRYTDG